MYHVALQEKNAVCLYKLKKTKNPEPPPSP